MSKKVPNPVDKHVGARVRIRRMELSMSQEKLGDALGLTFQQVQKYEKGANRIGSSRLAQIATALNVPIEYFFVGAPGVGDKPYLVSDPGTIFMATREGQALAKAFPRIASADARRRVVDLVEALAAA